MGLRIGYLTTAAMLAMAALPNAQAQTVPDEGDVAETRLNIPDQLTIFGQNDPNVRRATAVVNGDIITGTDVDHRLALILAANEAPVSAEEQQRLRLQVLRNLIDETLQIQEAEANEIVISDAEVNATLQQISLQNFGRDMESLQQYLRANNSSVNTLKQQIKGELAWSRLLRRNIAPFINIGEEEVNAIIERLEASKGKSQYRLGEIYMAATPETAQQVAANLNQILEQIRQGGSFVAYARQFSEASTASVGGDLGWVYPEQVPPALAAAGSQLQVGQVAGPIEVPGGLSIVYLIDRRQVLTSDPRDALLSLKQLSITFPPGTTEAQATAKASQFSEAAQAIRGCGDADQVAASIGAEVVDNDQVPVRNLPPQLQDSINALQIGQSTPPFGSVEDGVRVLVLCGRDDPQTAQQPSFDEIMGRLENERINKRAQIYLRDLRRDAIIDYN